VIINNGAFRGSLIDLTDTILPMTINIKIWMGKKIFLDVKGNEFNTDC
jgi:hypothetical protein